MSEISSVFIDFSNTDGIIKPMSGINNGPSGSAVRAVSNFKLYKDAQFPYARTHDSAFGDEHLLPD